MNKSEISYTSKVLDLHFSFADRIVDCNITKRFLPILADQDFDISIPTPITVHLEHCSKCQEDLRFLVSLDLRKDQLYVLSQLFAEDNNGLDIASEDIEADITLFATMNFSLISQPSLKYICTSKVLREKILKIRARFLRNDEKTDFDTCSKSFSDVFEASFPYSKIPQNLPGNSEADVDHIKHCNHCRNNAQILLKKIGEIYDRKNSGIATRLSLRKSDELKVSSEDYRDWPVDVEVININSDKEDNFSSSKQTPPIIKPKAFFIKHAKPISVAAGILLIFSLLFDSQPALATSLKEIITALKKIDTIQITKYDAIGESPQQIILMSKPKKLRILNNFDKVIIFDLKTEKRTIFDKEKNKKSIFGMPQTLVKEVHDDIFGSWEIIPDKLKNSTWQEVNNSEIKVPLNHKVFDLEYPDPVDTNRSWVRRIWFYANTNLPYGIEVYAKNKHNNAKTLLNIYGISYSAEKQINSLLETLNQK